MAHKWKTMCWLQFARPLGSQPPAITMRWVTATVLCHLSIHVNSFHWRSSETRKSWMNKTKTDRVVGVSDMCPSQHFTLVEFKATAMTVFVLRQRKLPCCGLPNVTTTLPHSTFPCILSSLKHLVWTPPAFRPAVATRLTELCVWRHCSNGDRRKEMLRMFCPQVAFRGKAWSRGEIAH